MRYKLVVFESEQKIFLFRRLFRNGVRMFLGTSFGPWEEFLEKHVFFGR